MLIRFDSISKTIFLPLSETTVKLIQTKPHILCIPVKFFLKQKSQLKKLLENLLKN